jgi:sugar/nucleoside kinase (ribokinase family)
VDVVAVGHAIVDVLAPTGDDVVAELGLTKGAMTLVDDEQAERIYAALGPAVEVSGGSAANTAVGLAALGADAAFVGKVRDDQLGAVFAHDIRAARVRFAVPAATAGPPTGRSIILVTPDAEKTMCTNLGIGGALLPGDVDEELISAARIVYIEGYLCGPPHMDATVEQVFAAATRHATMVALSLSDPVWVQLYGRELDRLLDRVDLLFANEQEACALAGSDDLNVVAARLAARVDTVVVTLGASGALVAHGGDVVRASATPVEQVVDTTGAGDMFAAGFLYGVTRDLGMERSARLGGVVAAEIVSHLGARPVESLHALAEAAGLLR